MRLGEDHFDGVTEAQVYTTRLSQQSEGKRTPAHLSQCCTCCCILNSHAHSHQRTISGQRGRVYNPQQHNAKPLDTTSGLLTAIRSKRSQSGRKSNETSLSADYDFEDAADLPGETPVYHKPHNTHQRWVNQYYLWYRRMHPRQSKTSKQIIDMAVAHWNSSEKNAETLLEILRKETPKQIPARGAILPLRQKQLGSFFATTGRKPNALPTPPPYLSNPERPVVSSTDGAGKA